MDSCLFNFNSSSIGLLTLSYPLIKFWSVAERELACLTTLFSAELSLVALKCKLMSCSVSESLIRSKSSNFFSLSSICGWAPVSTSSDTFLGSEMLRLLFKSQQRLIDSSLSSLKIIGLFLVSGVWCLYISRDSGWVDELLVRIGVSLSLSVRGGLSGKRLGSDRGRWVSV